MSAQLEPITFPNTIIPERVDDKTSEALAASAFAQFEKAIRSVENQRLEKTRPLNDVVADYIAAAKSLKQPLEEERDRVGALLEAYRLSPAVQTALAEVRNLKKDFREAEKTGDVTALELIGSKISEAEVPVSIAVDGGSVRFRNGIELLEIDETLLDSRYYKSVIDEKKIKEDLDLLGDVKGVTFRFTYKPSFFAKE